MIANYRLNTNELDIDFLDSIKKIFKNKNIDIFIVDEAEEDEKLAELINEGLKSETIQKEKFLEAIDCNENRV